MSKILAKTLGLAIAFVISFAILANLVSTAFWNSDPKLGLLFNPLNSPLRQEFLFKQLVIEKSDSNTLSELHSMAYDGVRLDQYSGVAHSIFGISVEKMGNRNGAQSLYSHALRLLPTEIQALLRRFQYTLSHGKAAEVMQIMELLLRRWPVFNRQLAPYYLQALNREDVFDIAIDRLPKLRDGGLSMFSHVSQLDGGAELLRDYSFAILKAGKLTTDFRDQALTMVNSKLGFEIGYEFFEKSLFTFDNRFTGDVFNSGFLNVQQSNPFDWRLPKVTGASAEFETKDNGGEFSLEFLGTPIRMSQLFQRFKASGKNFSMKIVYKTRDFKGPYPIALLLQCSKNGQLIENIDLVRTNNRSIEIIRPVEILNADCHFLDIVLKSKFLANTWNNRYEGKLTIEHISTILEENS